MDVYAVHNSVVTVIFSFWKSTCYVPPYSVFVRLCLLFQSLLLLTHTKFICIFMMYSHIEYQMPSSSRLLIIISVKPEAKYRCNAVAYLQKKKPLKNIRIFIRPAHAQIITEEQFPSR